MKLWNRKAQNKQATFISSGPPGKRAYAIGDVHGCGDLLDRMLRLIAADEQRLGRSGDTYLVFLGDLIDRGPDSSGVIERLITTDWGYVKPVFIMGNHEEMLLRLLGDEPGIVHDWLYYGGYQCAQSYGVEVGALAQLSNQEAVAALRAAIPARHIAFLESFVDSFRFGDYVFVHAGIRPGVPIEQQALQDLRWIREGFIDVSRNDALVVVHGHTIMDDLKIAPGRIGIDTGAYGGGGLSAVRIEEQVCEFLRATG